MATIKADRILFIVESPNKVKTVKQFLPDNYIVMASVGHICRINDSGLYNMGIDPTDNFKIDFKVPSEKKEVVDKLKEQVKWASKVILATDEDREGEAISYHLKNFLKIPEEKYERITYTEVTKKAVTQALNHPRKIDMQLVNAALDRSCRDKIVGYRLSGIARNNVNARSVGNCQSPGLGMIVDLEEEIENFVPEKFFELYLHFSKNNVDFKAKYNGTDKEEIKKLKSLDDCKTIVADCKKGQYSILSVEKKDSLENPKPPFITSTYQQEVSKKLGIGVKDAMDAAQKLFEGIEINGQHVGLITYHRTDSPVLSEEFVTSAKQYIEEWYSKDLFVGQKKVKHEENAQEGHEALRVVDVNMTPERLSKLLTNNRLLKIYEIIWKRSVASLCRPAVFANTLYTIQNGKHRFVMNSKELRDEGYRKIYSYANEDEKDEVIKETFNENEVLQNTQEEAVEKETTPPARYTEASFLKDLDKKGIGRPSTYATIINTLLDEKRGYVKVVDKKLVPTPLGIALVHFLKQNFPSVVDTSNRAKMEKTLDLIATGKKDYLEDLKDFYNDLEEEIKKVNPSEGEEKICPNCGKPMAIRKGKYGLFYGCTGYPDCKTIEPFKKK